MFESLQIKFQVREGINKKNVFLVSGYWFNPPPPPISGPTTVCVFFKYRPFHKTLLRSNAFCNWISVRFYETGCTKKQTKKKSSKMGKKKTSGLKPLKKHNSLSVFPYEFFFLQILQWKSTLSSWVLAFM